METTRTNNNLKKLDSTLMKTSAKSSTISANIVGWFRLLFCYPAAHCEEKNGLNVFHALVQSIFAIWKHSIPEKRERERERDRDMDVVSVVSMIVTDFLSAGFFYDWTRIRTIRGSCVLGLHRDPLCWGDKTQEKKTWRSVLSKELLDGWQPAAPGLKTVRL